MQVTSINRDYNYRLNFQAAHRVKINSKISSEVRKLADEADDLFGAVLGKDPVVKGTDGNVSVRTINRTRIDCNPWPGDRVVTLSGKVDGVDTRLEIYRNDNGDSTSLRLQIGDPIDDRGILYMSNFNGQETLVSVDGHRYPSYRLEGLHKYKDRNAFFEKYVGALLKPAEKIKELYNPSETKEFIG